MDHAQQRDTDPDASAPREQSSACRFYVVRYRGVFAPVERKFESAERATLWCRQIGRPDLIRTISIEEEK